MGLEVFWYIIIAFFWTGFFVLEGFDLGVGALHQVVGRSELERRVAINSIGPFWDGNEVWLIVAGASTFAAFPAWYATMFSSFYLALLLVLVALIVRGVSFEYRAKHPTLRWRSTWDWCLTIGSVALPLLLGIALGDLLHGLPINDQGNFTGNFLDLLTPYGIFTGLTLLSLTLAHGSTYLTLRTTGTVERRAARLAYPLAGVALLFVIGFVIWTHVELTDHGVLPSPLQVLAILVAAGATWAARDHHTGWAFAATTATIALTIASLFVALYRDVMVSSTSPANTLTIANSASSHYALTVMTIVAAVFTPLVLAYQGWSYYVFRSRVVGPKEGDVTGAPSAEAVASEGSATA